MSLPARVGVNYVEEYRQRIRAARGRMSAAAMQAAKKAAIEADKAALEADKSRQRLIKLQIVKIGQLLLRMEYNRNSEKILKSIDPEARAGITKSYPGHLTRIINEVAREAGVSVIDIMSQRRTFDVTLARHFIMWRARRETTYSLPAIGNRIGGRDHTTVLGACRRIDLLIKQNKVPLYLLATIPKGEIK